mgnify:CR=1 FL=1
MRLEELINKNYNRLNENDLYIWQYISAHRKECEKLSSFSIFLAAILTNNYPLMT